MWSKTKTDRHNVEVHTFSSLIFSDTLRHSSVTLLRVFISFKIHSAKGFPGKEFSGKAVNKCTLYLMSMIA